MGSSLPCELPCLSQQRRPIGAVSESEIPPLVLVHGLMGSTLVDPATNSLQFLTTCQVLSLQGGKLQLPLERLPSGAQVSDGLVAKEPLHELSLLGIPLATFYGPFIRKFGKSRKLHLFSYDWRRELVESSNLLEDFLASVVKESGYVGGAQVVCHSMGNCIMFPVLNRRPELFHSVLLAAPALGPDVTVLRDISALGPWNKLGLNSTLCTPTRWLGWTSSTHFLPSSSEKPNPHANAFLTEADGQTEVPVQFHDLHDWRSLRLGPFHPTSGIEGVSHDMATFFCETLKRAKLFREQLRHKPDLTYPPMIMLLGSGTPTPISYQRPAPDEPFDFSSPLTTDGDGRVPVQGALVPEGVPLLTTSVIAASHTGILSNVAHVEGILERLSEEATRRKVARL